MLWRRSPRGRQTETQPRRAHRTWRSRAETHVAKDEQLAFVSSLKNRNELPVLHADDLGEAILSDAAEAVVTTVAEHHSTYGRQNLLAEAHRILHGVRFASPGDRVAVAEQSPNLPSPARFALPRR